MIPGSFRFEDFRLDPGDRLLRRGDETIELNARYLDALVLLVREQGKLVSKNRFLEDVWQGVPVTDEALTQCIKTLRKQLGDDAVRPRFIETVPKHGYRFIAPVRRIGHEIEDHPAAAVLVAPHSATMRLLVAGASGTVGGGIAGAIGGLFYGFAISSQPGMGGISALLVLIAVTILVALLGGAGVAFGIAISAFASRRSWLWTILGGACGGLVVGALVKLLGLDAFNLLFGHAPGDITGAPEGALLGGAVGLGAWLAARQAESISLPRGMSVAALTAGAAGILIPLLGGHMFGGSLNLLAQNFPDSRLDLDHIGRLFGETGFGPISQIVTGGLEGALFGGCIVGAMLTVQQRFGQS